jgi:hypothetical protein
MRWILAIVLAVVAPAVRGYADTICTVAVYPNTVKVWEDSDFCTSSDKDLTQANADFRALRYGDGHSLHDSITGGENQFPYWVVFFADVGFGGHTLCVGPNTRFSLAHPADNDVYGHSVSGFNDQFDGIKLFPSYRCTHQPPLVCDRTVSDYWSDVSSACTGCG